MEVIQHLKPQDAKVSHLEISWSCSLNMYTWGKLEGALLIFLLRAGSGAEDEVERPRGLRRALLLPPARLRAQRRRRRPQVLLAGLGAARGAVPARGGRRRLLFGATAGRRPLAARRRPALLRAPGSLSIPREFLIP